MDRHRPATTRTTTLNDLRTTLTYPAHTNPAPHYANSTKAAGYWRNGILLAPRAAQLTCDAIADTLTSDEQKLLRHFSFNRFIDPNYRVPSGAPAGSAAAGARGASLGEKLAAKRRALGSRLSLGEKLTETKRRVAARGSELVGSMAAATRGLPVCFVLHARAHMHAHARTRTRARTFHSSHTHADPTPTLAV